MSVYTQSALAYMAPVEHEHFWYIARKQIILQFTPHKGKMLDIGCGNGTVMSYLHAYGLDVVGSEGVDIKDMTYQGEFDTIGLFDVLEHIGNDAEALSHCSIMLKPKGYLVLTLPASMRLWGALDQDYGHYRRYNKIMITALLKAMGYEVERVSYFCMFLLPVVYLLKRLSHNSAIQMQVFPLLNGLLLALMELEIFLLQYTNLPFGSSLIVRARKREGNG